MNINKSIENKRIVVRFCLFVWYKLFCIWLSIFKTYLLILFEKYSVIAWLKTFSWSHCSCLIWHVCKLVLIHANKFIAWGHFKALLNFSLDRCTSSFSIWFSEMIFSFDAWDITRISWIKTIQILEWYWL